MKHRLFFIAFIAMLTAFSCNKAVQPYEELKSMTMDELSIDVRLDEDVRTRAEYTSETDVEKKINDIQLLIFHEDGSLAYYDNIGTSESVSNISLTRGSKTVFAVANADDLSSVSTLSALTSKDIELGASNDVSSGFVMAGSDTVTVGVDSTAKVVMSRFVSRIVLNRVTNSLPSSMGTLTVDNAFITNVVGNQTLADGSDAPADWYNQMGRKTDATSSTAIIDGATYVATAPELTFHSIGKSLSGGASLTDVPYMFYTYPNDTVNDVQGWSSPFTARKTRLVVTATFNGSKYYYPVTIAGPTLRNNTYTVEMTITGPGSSDPDKPIEKDSFTAVITAQTWQGTTIYTETI